MISSFNHSSRYLYFHMKYLNIQIKLQVKARFYTSRTVTNDITLTFREYQNLPVMNVLAMWTAFIDPKQKDQKNDKISFKRHIMGKSIF